MKAPLFWEGDERHGEIEFLRNPWRDWLRNSKKGCYTAARGVRGGKESMLKDRFFTRRERR